MFLTKGANKKYKKSSLTNKRNVGRLGRIGTPETIPLLHTLFPISEFYHLVVVRTIPCQELVLLFLCLSGFPRVGFEGYLPVGLTSLW